MAGSFPEVSEGGAIGNGCANGHAVNEDLRKSAFVRYRGVTLCVTSWIGSEEWFNPGHVLFDGMWPSFAAWYQYEADTESPEVASHTTSSEPVNLILPVQQLPHEFVVLGQMLNAISSLDPSTSLARTVPVRP
jgi:hypothetical protein